ncbi:MAG: acetyl-CoA carboxylase biotin carboxyl carrier protein [Desulfotomaculaceae bacterium]|nr:acetyl-CoA carboxylase biotin carboxyl carrier protein [Desulfotomaculaceae bacterium]
MKNRVKITDTTLRDAHQSLWATRMRTADMLPIAEKLDNIGYHSLEVWGGHTFDVGLRYLNEDPWERLRQLKKIIRNTPLQMMIRGQSLVGYQQYPDDVVDAYITKSVENGISIIRIYDALNDIRNLETAIHSAKKAGAHVQAAMVYTVSPIHSNEHYTDMARQLAEMGADSICIKDTAGLLAPYRAYELVKALKKNHDLPVQLHCHYIGGLAVGTYLKAVEAGADVIDTATVPLAFGAAQPPVETVVRALHDSDRDTQLDIHKLFEIAEYFEKIRKEKGFKRGVTRINDMRVFDHHVPGGAITNLVTQLEEQKALYRLGEVLEDIPRVREDLGYPPLVTPTSQIVGTQAVLNVLTGERYKLVPGEVRDYIRGYYGRPPAPINQDIARKVLGDRVPINGKPSDLLEPRMEKLRNELIGQVTNEEDLISYALFPQVARRFFEFKRSGKHQEELPYNRKENLPKLEKTLAAAPEKAPAQEKGGGPKETVPPGRTVGRAPEPDTAKEVGELNISDVKDLIRFIDDTDITEVSLESAGIKLSVRKGGFHAVEAPIQGSAPRANGSRQEKSTAETTVSSVQEQDQSGAGLQPVKAPMVGTFYDAPSPESASYVKIGDKVKKGQVLCIIEAMKLMNEIKSAFDGEIMEVKVEKGQPVEYGQDIFLIKV